MREISIVKSPVNTGIEIGSLTLYHLTLGETISGTTTKVSSAGVAAS